MKGDFLAFMIAPIIFLVLTFVTAVLIVTSQQIEPILNATMTSMGVNATNQQIPTQLFNNLNSFNIYLPIVFYFVMFGILFSTVLLETNPLEWLVGVIYAPLIYYVSVYISNMAHTLLTFPQIASGIIKLPLPVYILADLPMITFIFALMYILCLSIRIWFYKPNPNIQ